MKEVIVRVPVVDGVLTIPDIVIGSIKVPEGANGVYFL
jgi:hypothetical protein